MEAQLYLEPGTSQNKAYIAGCSDRSNCREAIQVGESINGNSNLSCLVMCSNAWGGFDIDYQTANAGASDFNTLQAGIQNSAAAGTMQVAA